MTKLPSNFQWTKFAGLASQWAIALIALMYFGRYLDGEYLSVSSKPMFIWILPFLFILLSLCRIIRDTKKKSDDVK
jgi:membrane protein DedA with SNARE-associated domain